jgi:3-oxoacyl-(acyl-carrier-protein) synthase/enoyl-CoA hydratase/carnithine racemase/acyl carrier protein
MSYYSGFEFTTEIKNDDFIVRDHRVHGVRIMPGVTFFDVIYRILQQENYDTKTIELRNIVFKEAIATTEEYDRQIRLVLEGKPGYGIITASSRRVKDLRVADAGWSVNYQGEVHAGVASVSKTIDVEGIKNRSVPMMDMEQVYSNTRKLDIQHYDFMKVNGQIYRGDGYLFAEIYLGDLARQYLDSFYFHPAILDSATLVALSHHHTNYMEPKPYIPIYLESFRASGSPGDRCYVYVPQQKLDDSASKDIFYTDLEIFNEEGRLIAAFKKLAAKLVRSKEVIFSLATGDSREKKMPVPEVSKVSVNSPVAREGSDVMAGYDEAEIKRQLNSFIVQDLRRMTADIQGKQPEEVDLDEGYYEQGLDSSNLLEMVQKLENKLGQQLYPTLLFEYTNIRELAAYLEKEYAESYIKLLTMTKETRQAEMPPTEIKAPVAGQLTEKYIEQDLCGMIAGLLGRRPEEVSLDEGYYEQGLDSGNLLEMVQKLENKLGQQLYPTLLFEYTNIRELAAYLEKEYGSRYMEYLMSNGSSDCALTEEETGKKMYFTGVWEKSPVRLGDGGKKPGVILVFDTGTEVYGALKNRAADGSRVILVKPGTGYTSLEENIFEINPGNEEDYLRLFEGLNTRGMLPRNILYMWSKGSFEDDRKVLGTALEKGVYSLLYISKALMKRRLTERTCLIYAYSTGRKGRSYAVQPQHAAVSGFANTIHMENPSIVIRTVEVRIPSGTVTPVQWADIVFGEFGVEADQESYICYESGERYVRHMRELDVPGRQDGHTALRQGGTYIITGGAGGIGIIFAKYLAEKAKARIVIAGRSALNEEKKAKIREIEALGSEVAYVRSDISKREDVERLVAEARLRFEAINGVFHSAGVIYDSLAVNKTAKEMEYVFAPKVSGTVYLDEVLRDEKLDFFVLFSSTASVMGNTGQCDYTFANSFMDYFAAYRESLRTDGTRYGKTLSLNWPFWRDGGMRLDEVSEIRMKTKTGMYPMSSEDGLQAFEDGLRSEGTQLLVIRGDERKIRAALVSEAIPKYAENILTEERAEQTGTSGEDIAIIGLSGRYPLAKDINEFWENLKSGRNCITEIPTDRWDHSKYFDPDKNKTGTSYSKWGGFIDDVDKFDPLFFNIAPREAEYMDPQERLFLETAWQTIEDAGYTDTGLGTKKVGVFVGVMWGQYQLFETEVDGRKIAPMVTYATIANRVSYFFDFHGPSMAVDTMCSSSLTALHLACESIRRGESKLALAGGVNISIHPNKYISLSHQKFASSDGLCRAFGKGGDGYVPGEGVGAVLLKPLNRAVADGDRIYAVIKAESINSGGRSSGYTVPNPNAQAEAISEALRKAGVNPRSISYIEAHGTGTSLGDPIEITGLMKAFKEYTDDRHFCSIGSVKSNIGHLESAAGIAALTKVLLQFKYKQLVPSLHADSLNPNIDFDNCCFYVQRELAEWKQTVVVENGKEKVYPRRAGISSFGAGGANIHIILEEYVEPQLQQSIPENKQQVVVLSAKSEDRLRAYAQKLLEFLENNCVWTAEKDSEGKTRLPDIAYTLQTGRKAMDERLAVVVSDILELKEKLKGYLNGNLTQEGLYIGRVKVSGIDTEVKGRLNSVMEAVIEGRWDKLAQYWVNGLEVDWRLLHNDPPPCRISLPTYPFARKRYWIGSYKGKSLEAKPAVPQADKLPADRDGSDVKHLSGADHMPKRQLPVGGYVDDKVNLQIINGNIALVTMEDRVNKNVFSERVIYGLEARFEEIRKNPDIKAVIVTGYDNIFCMGGTQEQLNSIANKKSKFTDTPFLYRGFLEMDIPVISAMQGHASGGGMLFGLYADIIVMAEESIYTAVFTKYGFTPGMGATFILKEKLGNNLATEMMFTARPFQGKELKDRGASVIVRKRQDVLREAISIAGMLAEKPLKTLKVLKKELAGRVLEQLPIYIGREEQMHEQTFSLNETKQRIQRYYINSDGLGGAREKTQKKEMEKEMKEASDSQQLDSILTALEQGRITPEQALKLRQQC